MIRKRLTKEGTKKLTALRSLIYYYKKYQTERGKIIIKDLEARIVKIKSDANSYEPTELKDRTYHIRSIRAQIWNIKRHHPHRKEKRKKLEVELQQLLQTG